MTSAQVWVSSRKRLVALIATGAILAFAALPAAAHVFGDPANGSPPIVTTEAQSDSPEPSETAGATGTPEPSETAGASGTPEPSGAAANGVGGHADPDGANVDHQFDGEE